MALAETTDSPRGNIDPVKRAAMETVVLAAITRQGDLDLSKLIEDVYHASEANITWN